MTRARDRIIALVLAIAFFATTFALSFVVIWQLIHDKKGATVDQSNAATTPTSVLAGTKLPDFTPVSQVDSLQKIDTKVGTGQEAKVGDTITVDYTGAVAATGTIFQSSLDTGQPASLTLKDGQGGVIKGWADGIPGMKIGGTRRLVIPAAQAYGATPPQGSNIPANAALVFDVTLHAIGG